MDSILTLIAFFVVIFIFWMLASWLLPIILPIIIVFWIISLFTQRRHVHVHTYNSTQNQNEQPKSAARQGSTPGAGQRPAPAASKHGAIDVEYTEHEDDGDEQ